MKIKGLKRDKRLKTARNASLSNFVGTTGHNYKKRENLVLNGTYGHPTLYAQPTRGVLSVSKTCSLRIGIFAYRAVL